MPIGCLVAPPLHIAKVHAYSHPSVGQQVRINVVWKEMGRMCNSVVKTNVPLPLIIMGQPLAKGWGGIEPCGQNHCSTAACWLSERLGWNRTNHVCVGQAPPALGKLPQLPSRKSVGESPTRDISTCNCVQCWHHSLHCQAHDCTVIDVTGLLLM